MATEEIHQDKKLPTDSKKQFKKGGPYSKKEKEQRQDEVYRLYFEHMYSARKIADVMKVNRNTINEDIKFWHQQIFHEMGNKNLVDSTIKQIHEMELQKTRLREELKNIKESKQRLAIERLLFEIGNKLTNIFLKIRTKGEMPLELDEDVDEEDIKKLARDMVLKNTDRSKDADIHSKNEIIFVFIQNTGCDIRYAEVVFKKMIDLGLGACAAYSSKKTFRRTEGYNGYNLQNFAIMRHYVSEKEMSELHTIRLKNRDYEE